MDTIKSQVKNLLRNNRLLNEKLKNNEEKYDDLKTNCQMVKNADMLKSMGLLVVNHLFTEEDISQIVMKRMKDGIEIKTRMISSAFPEVTVSEDFYLQLMSNIKKKSVSQYIIVRNIVNHLFPDDTEWLNKNAKFFLEHHKNELTAVYSKL